MSVYAHGCMRGGEVVTLSSQQSRATNGLSVWSPCRGCGEPSRVRAGPAVAASRPPGPVRRDRRESPDAQVCPRDTREGGDATGVAQSPLARPAPPHARACPCVSKKLRCACGRRAEEPCWHIRNTTQGASLSHVALHHSLSQVPLSGPSLSLLTLRLPHCLHSRTPPALRILHSSLAILSHRESKGRRDPPSRISAACSHSIRWEASSLCGVIPVPELKRVAIASWQAA